MGTSLPVRFANRESLYPSRNASFGDALMSVPETIQTTRNVRLESRETFEFALAAFAQGLRQQGYREGTAAMRR